MCSLSISHGCGDWPSLLSRHQVKSACFPQVWGLAEILGFSEPADFVFPQVWGRVLQCCSISATILTPYIFIIFHKPRIKLCNNQILLTLFSTVVSHDEENSRSVASEVLSDERLQNLSTLTIKIKPPEQACAELTARLRNPSMWILTSLGRSILPQDCGDESDWPTVAFYHSHCAHPCAKRLSPSA